MSDVLARQELEAVLARFDVEPRNTVYVRAVRAILDGEPLEWCVVHDEARRPDWRDSCWALSVNVQLDGDCRFEPYVRVLVGP